jgi:hypothetical protein
MARAQIKRGLDMTDRMAIADLDVELSAIGGYDSVSGMPCGCLHGPIRPFIRPESAGDVPSLVSVEE